MNMIAWVLKLILAGTLGWAATAKIGAPSELAVEIANYQFFPGVAPIVASTLPGLELVLAVALISFRPRSLWLGGAALAATGLLAVFTIAIAQALFRDINIDCGCFGGGSGPVTWVTLVRDIALLGASSALLFINIRLSEHPSNKLQLPK